MIEQKAEYASKTEHSPRVEAVLRRKRTLAGAAIVAVGAVYLGFLYPSPEFCAYNKDDAGWFMTMGMNLAEYGRYTTDTFPQEDYGRHATWPPVFPLLLAAVVKLFGLNWYAIKLLMACLGLANLWLLWLLLRTVTAERGESDLACWTVLLTALSPMYFLFSHMTMTEIPFMLASTAALLLLLRTTTWQGACLAGLVGAVAFFTRGYGIVLLPTGVLVFLMQRNWPVRKRLLALGCFALPLVVSFVFWSWYTRHVIASQPLDAITSSFGNLGVISANLRRPAIEYLQDVYWYHARFVIHTLLPYVSKETALASDALAALGGFLAALAFVGCLIWAKRGEYVPVLWLVGSAALLLITGINSPRYHLTLLPFTTFFLLTTIRQVSLQVHYCRWLYPGVVGVLVAGNSIGLVSHLANPDSLRFLSPYWKDFQSASQWARQSLPARSVIATHAPQNTRAGSGFRSIRVTPVNSEWPPAQLAREVNIYVVGPTPGEDFTERSVLSESYGRLATDRRFELIFDSGLISIWQFSNPSQAVDSESP